ncbi:MAG: CsbD family protein [Candidatus Peribacteraceae bacterium]|nr:CsbD family protein [Candidatus Peribacteraceae bacterium]
METITHHTDSKMADTASEFRWNGTWNEFKGKAKQLWGDLTDDDLDVAEGNYQEAFGKIERKTGEEMDEIRRKFR